MENKEYVNRKRNNVTENNHQELSLYDRAVSFLKKSCDQLKSQNNVNLALDELQKSIDCFTLFLIKSKNAEKDYQTFRSVTKFERDSLLSRIEFIEAKGYLDGDNSKALKDLKKVCDGSLNDGQMSFGFFDIQQFQDSMKQLLNNRNGFSEATEMVKKEPRDNTEGSLIGSLASDCIDPVPTKPKRTVSFSRSNGVARHKNIGIGFVLLVICVCLFAFLKINSQREEENFKNYIANQDNTNENEEIDGTYLTSLDEISQEEFNRIKEYTDRAIMADYSRLSTNDYVLSNSQVNYVGTVLVHSNSGEDKNDFKENQLLLIYTFYDPDSVYESVANDYNVVGFADVYYSEDGKLSINGVEDITIESIDGPTYMMYSDFNALINKYIGSNLDTCRYDISSELDGMVNLN